MRVLDLREQQPSVEVDHCTLTSAEKDMSSMVIGQAMNYPYQRHTSVLDSSHCDDASGGEFLLFSFYRSTK
jgi:hypothetical protein